VTFAILAILGTVGWRSRHITARSPGTLALLTILLVLLPVQAELGTPQAPVPETGPLVIENQTGITIRNRRIHNPTGPCVTIRRSASVLIEGLEIGPCAGNGIAVTESHDVTIASSRISTQRSGRAGRDSGLGIHILTSANVVVRDIYTPNTCTRTVREGNLTGTAARVNLLPEADRLPPPPIPPLPHAP
jgi:Right handed beta helix region